jgi:DNA polymerase-3 subunit delta
VEIDEELVQKYVGISKDFNSFELQKAIAIGDILKANRIANYFAANPKSNPIIPTIALLYGFFTKLLIAHSQPDKTERGVASALKINPFFAKEYMVAMNRYPVPKAMSNIKHIHQADLASKGVSASMAEGQILKELIFKLMH